MFFRKLLNRQIKQFYKEHTFSNGNNSMNKL